MDPDTREATADPRRVATRDQLAEALTRLREHAGLTVRDVARRVDVPVATVSGYFSGRHVPPASAARLVRDVLAVCGCDDPAEVEAWLDAVARVRRAPGRRPAAAPVPYRGLAGFQPEDAEWFFGRERLTGELVGLVTSPDAAHPVVVVGASGSGKSSLLRAGLVPALAGDARALLFTPRPHPMLSLVDALGPALGMSAGELRAHDVGRLPHMVSEVTESAGTMLVLVVDQAEELFTVAEPTEAAAFVATLRALAAPSVANVRVVLAVRSDFYSAAMRMPDLLPALQHSQLVVGPMGVEDLRRAIVAPAIRAGADVEPALVDLLLRDLAPAAVAPTVTAAKVAHDDGALPLLSHALLATWERGSRRRLTVADYAAVGGIDGAVATTAEELWSDLDPENQQVARRLLLRLVHVADGVPVARRRVARAELPPGFEPIVARFVDGRLLTARDDTVEIAHEALLRAWPRLRRWVDEDQVGLRLRRALSEASATWRDNGRDPHLLQRGAPLETTRQWVEDHANRDDLTPLEHEFLDASVAHAAAQQAEQTRQQRRLRALALALTVLLVVAVGLAAVSLGERHAAEHQRDLAVSRQLATTTERVRTTDVAVARQLALAAYRISPTDEARSSLLSLTAAASPTRLPATDGVLQAVAFSPDGHRLVAAGAGGTPRVWRVTDRRDIDVAGTALPGASGTLYAAAFSPDGRLVAAAGSDRKVHVWDVSVDARPQHVAALDGPKNTVYSVAFSADGHALAAGSADGEVSTWAVRPDHTIAAVPRTVRATSGAAVQAIAASRRGGLRAAAAGNDVVLADASGRLLPHRLTGATGAVTSVAFSPDGRTLAAGSQDRTVRLWDVTRPSRPRLIGEPLAGATNWVNAVAFSPDGRTLVTGSSDNQVRVWDVATQTVREVYAHPAPVTAVAVAPDGRTIATGANDGVARLWSTPGPSVAAGQTNVFGVAYLRGDVLASGGSDGVHIWRVDRGGLQAAAGPVGAGPRSGRLSGALAAAPDGRTLAAAGADGTVHLFDAVDPAHPALTATLTAGTQMVEMVAFSRDGRLLAAGSDDGTVSVWDMTRPGRPRVAHLTGPKSYVNGVAFSPDHRLLAAGSADNTVWVWDVSDMARPRAVASPLTGPRSYVYSVAFSPDGRTLAASSDDRQVWLWDVSSPSRPRRLAPLHGPDSYVYCIAFANDGRTLAAASGDGGVWLYDVAKPSQARRLATLTGAAGAQFTVTFSPDGRAVVAGGADKVLRLWHTSTTEAARDTCAEPGAPLSRSEWARYAPGVAYRDLC